MPQLADWFLKTYAVKHGRKLTGIAPGALALLKEYEFPGNVRELANSVERAVIVSVGKRLEESDLPATVRAAVLLQQKRSRSRTLAEIEAAYIAEVLSATNGNKTAAARILGISRKNLYEKIARYNLG